MAARNLKVEYQYGIRYRRCVARSYLLAPWSARSAMTYVPNLVEIIRVTLFTPPYYSFCASVRAPQSAVGCAAQCTMNYRMKLVSMRLKYCVYYYHVLPQVKTV